MKSKFAKLGFSEPVPGMLLFGGESIQLIIAVELSIKFALVKYFKVFDDKVTICDVYYVKESFPFGRPGIIE
jgi:hypothetical protein